MADEPKSPNFGAMFQGVRMTSLQAERPPTTEEEDHRRRKEMIAFYVKEVAVYALALIFILVMGGYSCIVVAARGVTSPEAGQAMPLLMSLFGAIVGLAFGKATS